MANNFADNLAGLLVPPYLASSMQTRALDSAYSFGVGNDAVDFQFLRPDNYFSPHGIMSFKQL